MLARVETCVVLGVDALPLFVEVSLTSGLPSFTVVGLAQGAVREGRERVSSALRTTGLGLPNRRITVNLAPADVRKAGTGLDLPIALGILLAAGRSGSAGEGGVLAVGELGLDGAVRPVSGVIPAALLARRRGLRLIVPAGNRAEACMVPDVDVLAVSTLREAIEAMDGAAPAVGSGPGSGSAPGGGAPRRSVPAFPPAPPPPRRVADAPDLEDVRGQAAARRALEVCAAGGHNLLFVGPPGVGKTMLARRLPGILPPLELEEALDVARIASAAGRLVRGGALPDRPFRAPHHSVSYAGLLGGGAPVRPGEISLAHHGVLFLDELPEFRRDVLEGLRQPLEEGAVTLARATGAVRLPARFALVAAMNPCPCGRRGDGTDRCLCDDAAVDRYRARVSGPLLDRIDLRVELPVPATSGRAMGPAGEPSAAVADRVAAARGRQREARGCLNARLDGRRLAEACALRPGAEGLLREGTARLGLSMRGRVRVLRVARTIADLEGSGRVGEGHVAEAFQYRPAVRG